MSEPDNVIRGRFNKRASAASQLASLPEKMREDGASAWRRLNRQHATVADADDRERIARNIGLLIKERGKKRAEVAAQAKISSKEVHRLVLEPGDSKPRADRLRARAKGYADLIEAIAKLSGLDKMMLAAQVTYGTALHPSSTPRASEVEWMMARIYELVDGIEKEFHLLERFQAIRMQKAALPISDPLAFWPEKEHDDFVPAIQTFAEYVGRQGLRQDDFWLASQRLTPRYLGFEFRNYDWPELIGTLPHCYLGLGAQFDSDCDFWLLPPEAREEKQRYYEAVGTEKELPPTPNVNAWHAHVLDELERRLGNVNELLVRWSEDGALLFNGQPAGEYLAIHARHHHDLNLEADPERGAEGAGDGLYSPPDTVPVIWICVYPNPDASALVPIIMSCNEYANSVGNIVSLTEETLAEMMSYPLVRDQTIGSALLRALEADRDEPPRLMAEWRQTAPFVEKNPLYRIWQRRANAEKQIRDWRDRLEENATAE